MNSIENQEYVLKMRELRRSYERFLALGLEKEVQRCQDEAYGLGFHAYMDCVRKHEQIWQDIRKEKNPKRIFDLFDLSCKYLDIRKQYSQLLNSLAEQSLGLNLKSF